MITADSPVCRDVTMPVVNVIMPVVHSRRAAPGAAGTTPAPCRPMVDLSRLGADSCGVWTRAHAVTVLTPGEIDTLVRTRAWQVIWRGVYADNGYVLSEEQRAWAAVLAAGGAVADAGRLRLRAVAAGRTAARVWSLPLVDDRDPSTGGEEHLLDEVAVTRRLPQQQWAGRTLHPRRIALSARDVVRLPAGLWVTTPLRTLIDCAAVLPLDSLVCLLDAALRRGLFSADGVRAVVDAQQRRPGCVTLRAAVELADGRAESPQETLARLLLLPHVRGLEPQVELFDDAGRPVARFDLGDRRARLAVECDGKAAHAGEAMVAKDRRRDRRTEAHGWRTERVTWFELRRQPAAVVERIVEVHRRLSEQRLRGGPPELSRSA